MATAGQPSSITFMGVAELPTIIQGGMGIGVSHWPLARAVSRCGQLGVVSGTLLDIVFARRLQDGDAQGHLRRALSHLPIPCVAERILDRYFVAGGKGPSEPYRATPMPALQQTAFQLDLLVAANFVEVFLAKEGHDGLIGINYLRKIEPPTLPSLFGAMLARVDVVLMGAGIPTTIPGILDRLAQGLPVELPLDVVGGGGEDAVLQFDPRLYCGERGAAVPILRRPNFYAIVSYDSLATMLMRKATGRIDGFIIEDFTAGGHNARPRGPMQLNEKGEPIFGPRDAADLAVFRKLGLPFWLAGTRAHPDRVREAIDAGAQGVQIGTAFAFCEEFAFTPDLKQRVRRDIARGQDQVITDPLASPAGLPFKIVQLDGTLSDRRIYESRPRHCDLGYFRHAYRKADGSIGWRCAAEPIDDYIHRGGAAEETVGRQCLCNSLISAIGLRQVRHTGEEELPLVTAGIGTHDLVRYTGSSGQSYHAEDVINDLLTGAPNIKA